MLRPPHSRTESRVRRFADGPCRESAPDQGGWNRPGVPATTIVCRVQNGRVSTHTTDNETGRASASRLDTRDPGTRWLWLRAPTGSTMLSAQNAATDDTEVAVAVYSSAGRVRRTSAGQQPLALPFLEEKCGAQSVVLNLYYPLVIVLYTISALRQGNLGHC